MPSSRPVKMNSPVSTTSDRRSQPRCESSSTTHAISRSSKRLRGFGLTFTAEKRVRGTTLAGLTFVLTRDSFPTLTRDEAIRARIEAAGGKVLRLGLEEDELRRRPGEEAGSKLDKAVPLSASRRSTKPLFWRCSKTALGLSTAHPSEILSRHDKQPIVSPGPYGFSQSSIRLSPHVYSAVSAAIAQDAHLQLPKLRRPRHHNSSSAAPPRRTPTARRRPIL